MPVVIGWTSPAVADDAKLKFARYTGADGKPVYGVVEGDKLREITGAPFGEWKRDRPGRLPIAQAKFLAVTDARNVYALAGNYQDHLVGLPPERLEKYKIPQFFLKTPACLCGHGDEILYPKDAGRVDYEGELVIVIGKGGRDIPKEKALESRLRRVGRQRRQCPRLAEERHPVVAGEGVGHLRPVRPVHRHRARLRQPGHQVRVNGEVKMKTNTKLMVHDIPTTVSFLSKHVTLQPGDLIFTGTAGKTEPIKVGDVVEVELQGVGVLRNKVAAGK